MNSYIYDLPPSPNYTVEEIVNTSRPMGKRYRDGVLYRADYCSCIGFIGTASTLIAAGVVEDHMFPGQPGRNKVSQRFPPLNASYKKGLLITQISRRAFEVSVPFAHTEFLQRRDAWNEKQLATRWEPTSTATPRKKETKTRDKARSLTHFSLKMIRNALLDEDDNLLFDESTICQFEQLAAEMESLLEDDEPAANDVTTSNPDSRVTAARNDQQLQSFLRAAAHDSSLIDSEKPEGL